MTTKKNTPPRTKGRLPDLGRKKQIIDNNDPAWEEFIKTAKPIKPKRTGKKPHNSPALKYPAPLSHNLDLHGMTEAEAHKTLTEWLAEIEKTDSRTAVVITGLGKNRQGILKTNVPKWLEGHPLISSIDNSSGGGALKLRLKRKKCHK